MCSDCQHNHFVLNVNNEWVKKRCYSCNAEGGKCKDKVKGAKK